MCNILQDIQCMIFDLLPTHKESKRQCKTFIALAFRGLQKGLLHLSFVQPPGTVLDISYTSLWYQLYQALLCMQVLLPSRQAMVTFPASSTLTTCLCGSQ